MIYVKSKRILRILLRKPKSFVYHIFENIVNRSFDRRFLDSMNRNMNKEGLNDSLRDMRVVVTFSTFPARAEYAAKVADIMLRQSYPPDLVICNLVKSEWSKHDIPDVLAKLTQRGLQINWQENNYKTINKIYETALNYSDSVIITVDDDICYRDKNFIQKLIRSYERFPFAVSCFRAHGMRTRSGAFLPYKKWDWAIPRYNKPSFDLFATGVGGVLYPEGFFSQCKNLLIEYAPEFTEYGDDLLLKMIELKAKVPVVVVKYSKTIVNQKGSQKISRAKINVDEGLNDVGVKYAFERFDLPNEIVFGE